MRIRAVTSPYQITQKYGYDPTYPLNNGNHYGTDYVTGDKKILAPQDAKVTAKGFDNTNGNYLVLEANGYRDWFSHLSSYSVGLGDTVKQGQVVGYMGKTGAATGTHLHHSLRVNGVMVDPEQHITGKEGNKMFPNNGDLDNFAGRTGWPGKPLNNNDRAYWTQGTGNASWSKGADQVWKDLMYEVTEFVLKKPAPAPPNATVLNKGIYEVK